MPFKPGESPNASGAPAKETRLSTWIAKEMEKEIDPMAFKKIEKLAEYEEKVTAVKALAHRIVTETLAAESLRDLMDGAQFIADRTEGKPQQPIDHTTKGERIDFNAYTEEQLRGIIEG